MKKPGRKQLTKRNIVLIGPMGTGKSHIGRTLARELSYRFIDTDRLLERNAGMSLAELAAEIGRDDLFQREQEVIEQVRRYHHAVVAVGGNFVLREEMLEKLQEYGIVILLYAHTFRLVERVEKKVGKRPTIDYGNVAKCMSALNREWFPLRRKADRVINTTYRSPARIVKEIGKYIKQSPYRLSNERNLGQRRRGATSWQKK